LAGSVSIPNHLVPHFELLILELLLPHLAYRLLRL